MSILDSIFSKRSAATSAGIVDEIAKAEADIAAAQDNLVGVYRGLELMDDAAHERADKNAETFRRSIARLEAKVAALQSELPAVKQAEEAEAAKAATIALKKRADAARKAVRDAATGCLTEYAKGAGIVSRALEALAAIEKEVTEVNALLRETPVAEAVAGVTDTHRKAPDRETPEVRERRKCWVYKTHYGDEVRPATIDASGEAVGGGPTSYDRGQSYVQPTLEMREVVISSGSFRPGRYLESLVDGVRLPPATIKDDKYIWPRGN